MRCAGKSVARMGSRGACVLLLAFSMAGGIARRGPAALADSTTPPPQPSPAAALAGNVRLNGETPAVVIGGQAQFISAAVPSTPMTVNVGLPYRNQAELSSFLANEASHGVYMSQNQFDAEFAPTANQVQAVESWAAANGLTTTYAAADGILLSLRGPTASVEAAFGVQINNYRSARNGLFYSASTDPTVPAGLGINSVIGLDNIARFHALSRPALRRQLAVARARAATDAKVGFYPSDFRGIYDVGHGYDGTDQVIGFTLWGAPVSQTDLTNFAAQTGEPMLSGTVFNPSGVAPAANAQPTSTAADQIDWVYTDGVDTTLDVQDETAMDIEEAHGMAPHAHLVYYLANQTAINGQGPGLQVAINLAANNPLIHVVSDSWGGGDIADLGSTYASSTDQSFQHADAVGTTFYFSSGDRGSDSGGIGTAEYPASSPYVVAVGGTSLTTNGPGVYGSETVWGCVNSTCQPGGAGGGAGCAQYYTQPSWQAISNVTTADSGNCTVSSAVHRFEPDVAADADPATGAQVYYTDNTANPPAHVFSLAGGTSLAAPLWAGMAAVADRYAGQNSLPRIGWAAPKIYALAANAAKYAQDYHDVPAGGTINGSILYPTGSGWDEATGWGSIDWWNWVRDMVGAPGTQTVTLPLTTGWNLITLPLSPTTPLDARTVLTTLLAQTHGGYAEIDSYSSGQFTPSMFADPGGGLPLGGTNFTLQVGHGYALYTDTTGNISVTGTPAATPSLVLTAGWNLVGFPDAATNPAKADDILTGLLAQTHGAYAEIDSYSSGQFTPSAFADPGGGLPLGGTNFTVQPGQGYALYTDTGATQNF